MRIRNTASDLAGKPSLYLAIHPFTCGIAFKGTASPVSSPFFYFCSSLFVRRGESDPDPGQPDRPAIGRGCGADRPPQQGGAEGRVADPDWIRIQTGQWIRIQEGKNDAQK